MARLELTGNNLTSVALDGIVNQLDTFGEIDGILTIEDNQNILFKNEITNQQVKYLIEKSKAIVLGSIAYEGHPVILSEGIMANTILICPLFSGIDELMPEKYDYFYQHNSSIDLTKALNRLADFEMYQENKQELLKFKKEKYRDSLFFSQFEKIIN